MSKPLLNLFQTDAILIQKAGAAVPQIVKTNLPHTVLLQDQRKMLCDIAGLYKLTDFVYIDIIGEFPAIRFPAQLSV